MPVSYTCSSFGKLVFDFREVRFMQFKKLIGGAGVALALAASAILPGSSAKAAAYGAAFQTSITYQNVGTQNATVEFQFFPEGSGTGVPVAGGTLAPGASTSLLVAAQQLGTFSKGSAVLSASQPVVATIVQFATGIANRPLSNGFGDADANARQLVATVLKNTFNTNTIFSVQNVEAAAANIQVQFFAVGNPNPVYTLPLANTPAYSARYVDVGRIAQLGNAFNGSAVVTSALANGQAARTVISVNELGITNNIARGFEGTANSGDRVYMASALCRYGAAQQTHAYAVQALDGPASFRVVYTTARGQVTATQTFNLASGGKQSVLGCGNPGGAGVPQNQLASAVIEKVSGTGKLVAVGKVSGRDVDSAFLGVSTGAARLAGPYARWAANAAFSNASNPQQRSFIAIQNVGTTPATNVTVKYINNVGAVVATDNIGTLAPGAKANSDPRPNPARGFGGALDACGRFGYYGPNCTNTQFGGGVLIESAAGSQLTAVVRVVTGGPNATGEDYNGIPIQ